MKTKKIRPGRVIAFLLGLVGLVFLGGILTRSSGEWICDGVIWTAVGEPKGLPPSIDCRPTPTFSPQPTEEPYQGTPFGGSIIKGGEISTESAAGMPHGFNPQEATESGR